MQSLCPAAVRAAILVIVASPFAARAEVSTTQPAATQPAYVPTSAYERREIRGWTVRVERALLEDAPLAARVLDLLDSKLLEVTRVVPAPALAKLKTVPIWMELNDPKVPGGVYHPSKAWLVGHGFNPDKAKCAEFGNAKNFLTWSIDQPNMVLHELAHAYHDQVVGNDNAEVIDAYRKAKEAGKYEAVLRINGHVERAYAMNNPQEYFAESTEAFFGTNDFYPFVRAELKQHDPEMYEVLKRAWGK